MNGKGKMKVLMRSEDGETVYCEDPKGKLCIFRTVRGKYEDFGADLRRGTVLAQPHLVNGDDPRRDGQPLTAEEKAYRKGFRACFAEIERMKHGKRSSKAK